MTLPWRIRGIRTQVIAVLLVCLAVAGSAIAVETPDLTGLASDQRPIRIDTLIRLGASRDARLVPFLEAYRTRAAFVLDGRVVLAADTDPAGLRIALDPRTRAALGPALDKEKFIELSPGFPEKKAAVDAIARLSLADPDPKKRLDAVTRTGDQGGDTNRTLLVEQLAAEPDAKIRNRAEEGIAIIDLTAGATATRARAASRLGELHSSRAMSKLRARSTDETDPTAKAAVDAAINAVENWQSGVRVAQTAFSGLSAGSILVIMALGLAITFGLMGVINMAHGEMLMIGAYAMLCVQMVFSHLPAEWQRYDLLIGLPAGFIAAAAVGWLLELTIIRHLYGRPLETLLATWGISYLLIEVVRKIFGENRAVAAPEWLSGGGWEPMTGLVLPWNRLFIIVITVASVAMVWWLLGRTRLGLLLRATVQSRRTATALGVDTRRIDGLTFALGSGMAGAAGCALTLTDGIKPDMGQGYIIDSFLVVAAGGVGNLWGVVCAGLSLGVLNKVLEPMTNAVFAKVLVLMAIVAFLQSRPQGLFPPRGRLSDG